jgi:hypothetical protein
MLQAQVEQLEALVFALFKHCGGMLQAQVEQLEALREADRQRVEALEA